MTLFSCCFRQKVAPPKLQTIGIDEEFSRAHNIELYTYKELSIATDNFSPAMKIGQGGFGSVYKGMLKNGTMVAIKVLSAQSRQGVKEFVTELTVISDINHENLVKLYGCCVEGSHRIIVYGYLENLSLAQTLLDGGHNIKFDWERRKIICHGVVKGLAYLHEEVRPHIVHRDIKASNVLLDKDLTPKISDFGLAKLFPDNQTHVSTRVAGTIGYLAPEYAIQGQLTRKADIYSFGVLLLEIVSGRCNTNNRVLPLREQNLLEWAWEMYEKGNLARLVDTSLEMDTNIEEPCKFMKIALLCTQDKPKLRPSMSTVMKMMTGEIDINDMDISRPSLLSELHGLKSPYISSLSDDKKQEDSSSSRNTDANTDASHGTMTFTGIYDGR